MIDYILTALRRLIAIDSPTGYTAQASGFLMEELASMGYSPQRTRKGGVLCGLGGEGEGLCLLAHADTLGGMVAAVKDSGRLRITPLGGLSPQNTEGENCRVYTRDGRAYSGTLQLENPSVHVNREYNTKERSFDTMEVVLDEDVSTKEAAKALGIRGGDIVCFDPRFTLTDSGYIKSRFLDDKLSAAILLGLAKWISQEHPALSRRLCLHFTVFEEIGHGACASLPDWVTELISVDMGCVGQGLECTERMVSICVKDSQGPSNYDLTTRLIQLAEEQKLSYALDVYPFYGSDGDAALRAGYDLRHGLIGPGVYASHGYERSHKDGVENTFRLLKACVTAL